MKKIHSIIAMVVGASMFTSGVVTFASAEPSAKFNINNAEVNVKGNRKEVNLVVIQGIEANSKNEGAKSQNTKKSVNKNEKSQKRGKREASRNKKTASKPSQESKQLTWKEEKRTMVKREGTFKHDRSF